MAQLHQGVRGAFLTPAALLLGLVSSPPALGQGGHGPVFGLATPTLPEGAWNADFTLMSAARGGRAVTIRETVRYGLTPNVQLNVSVPQRIESSGAPLRTRIGTMMGGMGDAELSVFWRPHVRYPGVGRRFESTVIFSGLYRVAGRRADVDTAAGFHAAAVTGYASRAIYAWGGGGYQHYFEKGGDRPGDLRYLSVVFGWRPPIFQRDYPKPDWRMFVESLAEFVGHDQSGGVEIEASGGERVFVGPTVLGLYGKWGVGAGAIFPVYQNHRDDLASEEVRYTVNVSYWF